MLPTLWGRGLLVSAPSKNSSFQRDPSATSDTITALINTSDQAAPLVSTSELQVGKQAIRLKKFPFSHDLLVNPD